MDNLMQLYARKGEIVTTMEILQAQLQAVNQQIIKVKNEEMQKVNEKDIDKPKKKE